MTIGCDRMARRSMRPLGGAPLPIATLRKHEQSMVSSPRLRPSEPRNRPPIPVSRADGFHRRSRRLAYVWRGARGAGRFALSNHRGGLASHNLGESICWSVCMDDAIFYRPRSPALHFLLLSKRQGGVLIPDHQPIRSGRLVK